MLRNVPELWKFCSHFSENHERITLTYVSIFCFLHFSPLVFLLLWPGTNFYMLTILTIQKKLHFIVRISPQSGMHHFQLNAILLTILSRADPKTIVCLNDALERLFTGLAGKQGAVLTLSLRLLMCLSTLRAIRQTCWFWGARKDKNMAGNLSFPPRESNATSTSRQNGVCY